MIPGHAIVERMHALSQKNDFDGDTLLALARFSVTKILIIKQIYSFSL